MCESLGMPLKTAHSTTMLQIPNDKYTTLEDFIASIIAFGKDNPNAELYEESFRDLSDEILQSIRADANASTEPKPRLYRPSANLSCQGISHFIKELVPVAPIPAATRPVLRMGHTLHAETYAAFKSACPEGIRAIIEIGIDLPAWWPQENSRNTGTIDMILYFEKELLTDYLSEDLLATMPDKIIADVKSTSFFGFKKMKTQDYEVGGNDFGYISQLAIYSEVENTLDAGALLIGVNRNSPQEPPCVRFISAERLRDEAAKVQGRVQEGIVWKPEKFEDNPGTTGVRVIKKASDFVCGNWATGKEGYCPYTKQCMEKRKLNGYNA